MISASVVKELNFVPNIGLHLKRVLTFKNESACWSFDPVLFASFSLDFIESLCINRRLKVCQIKFKIIRLMLVVVSKLAFLTSSMYKRHLREVSENLQAKFWKWEFYICSNGFVMIWSFFSTCKRRMLVKLFQSKARHDLFRRIRPGVLLGKGVL